MAKRKRIVLVIFASFLLAGIILGAALLSGAFETEPYVDLPQGELAYIGEHIGVSAEELSMNIVCLTGLCPNRTTYYNDTVRSLSERETLAYHARKEGLEITDEEAQTAADARRAELEEQLNYEALVKTYADAIGVSPEEYWEVLPNNRTFRQQLLVAKFTDKLLSEHKDMSEADFQSWLSEYTDALVAQENLKPSE